MKKARISELIEHFCIKEDCAIRDGLLYYFYRIFPPNISTMAQAEKQDKIRDFCNVLKNVDLKLQIFVIDKAENLSANIEYVTENIKPKFEEIKTAIVDEISKAENQKNSIQRAFYIVVESSCAEEQNYFTYNAKENGILFEHCKKRELISILRSFFLREFGTFDLMGIEQKATDMFLQQKNKRKAKTKEVLYAEELLKRILPVKITPMSEYISQGNFLRQTLLVKNMPASFDTLCMLSKIAQLEKSTINIRISDMNKGEAVALVNKQINSSLGTTKSRKATERIEADKETETMSKFYSKFIDDDDKIFKVNIFIEIYGENTEELKTMRDKVTSKLSPITYEILKFDMADGFKGVFPLGDDKFKILANNIPGQSLAALYPFAYSSRNDPEGLLLGKTEDGGYMFVDFWLRNQFITNGSYIILGESGYGKSYLQKKIISQYIARGYRMFIFDNEGEYRNLVATMGGTNINSISKTFLINPFQIRGFGSPDEDTYETDTMNTDGMFFQHLSWLKEFLKILIPDITNKELSVLMMLIQDMYQLHNINEFSEFTRLAPTDYPTFTDLYQYIEKVLSNKAKFPFYKMVLNEDIQTCLLLIREAYCGSLSPMFNGHTHLINADIINFDIQQLLMGSTERTQAYLFNVMTYIWSRIITKEKRTMMCVDELYLLCNPENMVMVRYLRDFIKRVRKYNALIGTATQQIADCMDPQIYTYTSALFNVPAFKFMFNCGDMDYENIKRFLSLTEGEQAYIKTAQKKHCLLKAGATDKYNMIVGSLSFEKELFGSAGGF